MPLALAAMAILALVTLGYAGVCAASPFGTCRRCNGLGFALTTDRRGKPCRPCRGHGKRIRVGRWLYNRTTRLHHEGTHAPAPAHSKEARPWP
ncbi:hypothetical protein V1J52_16875 [Streptomyces sp. TRM 70351]|uniref:hypothetical protein n=1 Tax=Streptomyces sp. TRM 70351 TaxID=3116552 RepID=UPI002E7C0A87|nr:hypothetical protein [Streptomyces sp. TRM 70351]MEE1929836.1 hypothetical protein [Streptomyces sp. TRM 70351]